MVKTDLRSCTEKTALLCQVPGGRGGKFKLLHFLNFMNFYLKNFEDLTMLQLMWKQQQDVFELNKKTNIFAIRSFLAMRNTDFSKNKQLVQAVGLKHINLFKFSSYSKNN